MWYIICQKDPSDFFTAIQDENSGSNDEKGKLFDRQALPGCAVKLLLRNIVYNDFTETCQAALLPP